MKLITTPPPGMKIVEAGWVSPGDWCRFMGRRWGRFEGIAMAQNYNLTTFASRDSASSSKKS